VLDPIAAQPAPVVAAPPTEVSIVGVFVGRATTAQLIDDSEYEPRWQESIATRNWRASLQRQKQGRFIG
jgi:hypothetical protein